MKEDIFLLYREEIQPRIRFLLSVFRRFYSLNLRPHLNPRPKTPSPQFRYLVVNEEHLPQYLEQGLDASVFRASDYTKPKADEIPLLLGQYDQVIFALNYLRKAGFKALWDQTWMVPDGNKPMWKRRVSVVEAIYADLMTEKMEDRSCLLDQKSEWIDFENLIFDTYSEHKEEYKAILEGYLKEGWELDRINPITVSIILEAISEYQALKTEKVILITQSVKTAQNYCSDEDYKIINAILDNYFKANG